VSTKRPSQSRARQASISGDLALIIEAMPAAVVLLRDGRKIAEVSGRYGTVFGRPMRELLGADLLRFVAAGDGSLVGSVIHEARSTVMGAVPASVVARFEQPDGSKRLMEVSAAHREDDTSDGATVVLLRPQSVRHGLNAVLTPHLGLQESDEQYTAIQLTDDLLVTIANVLGCEPVSHDCYFLSFEGGSPIAVKHITLTDSPSDGTAGPWDEVLSGEVTGADAEVAELSPELQLFARRKRFTAVRCFPVMATTRHRVVACLVAWDRREGPISPATEATFRYAAEIASLAISRSQGPSEAVTPMVSQRSADIDVVTGLGLEPELVRSLDEKIAGGERPALVCVRLSALEGLRESLGTFTIDTITRVAARRVNSMIRQTDELYRFGADCIAVVCSGAIDADRLSDIALRIRAQLGAPIRVDADVAVNVGAEIATAQTPEGGIAGSALLTLVTTMLDGSLQTA
jgi:GGDEF domain-containing protein